jgi:hypothetical protein
LLISVKCERIPGDVASALKLLEGSSIINLSLRAAVIEIGPSCFKACDELSVALSEKASALAGLPECCFSKSPV